MNKNIYKFPREFLEEGNIHVRKKTGDTSFAAHRHEYYEMILYQKCNGKCIINGSVYPISDNCLFLLTPKDYHKIEAQNPDDAGSFIVSFSERLIDPDLSASLAFSPRVWYSPSRETVHTIENLYNTYTKDSENRQKKLFHILNTILCDVFECGKSLSEKELCISPAIAKAITVMLSDMSKNYTLESLSRTCGLSASYFSTVFHKEMGKSFKVWLNDTRIEHAKGLLTEGDLPLLTICYECGYNTPSQFIRMFKKVTGLPPSVYRKAKKALHE